MDSSTTLFRSIIERDDVFMGTEFLSSMTRVVFGKKVDSNIQKQATILSKEMSSFISTVKVKQSETGVNLISLTDVERKILEYTCKSFRSNAKLVDGDIALEKFKSLLAKDPVFESEDAKQTVSKYTLQVALTSDEVSEIQSNFSNKKSMFSALGQYEVLRSFVVNDYKSCNSWEDLVSKMNTILKGALMNIQSYEYDEVNSIDLSNVSVSSIKKSTDTSTKISTGYRVLDNVLTGGFEPQRIYMFGGISGGGKSLALVNFAFRSKIFLDSKYQKEANKHAVMYISLENSVSETSDRFICCTLARSPMEITYELDNENCNLDTRFNSVFNDSNTAISIVYRPAKSINAYDVQTIISDYERKTNRKVDICYIDYADKMSAVNASKSDQEWRDLGYIIDELKSTSIVLNIPIITVTQLNRDIYQKGSDNKYKSPTGGNVSGSIRKRENVDFFGIFDFKAKEEIVVDYNQLVGNELEQQSALDGDIVQIMCSIDKNRMGPSGIKFYMYFDFKTYRMLNYRTEDDVIKQYGHISRSELESRIDILESDSDDFCRNTNL